MKKRSLLILGILAAACHLTACGQKATLAESQWAAAKKADDTAAYVTEHRAELDDLKTEAESSESLGQQFKAVALLCMAEYQDQLSSADSSMLTGQVKHDAYYPYDYLLPMLAAAKNIDGQTLSRLLNETALEGTCKT